MTDTTNPTSMGTEPSDLELEKLWFNVGNMGRQTTFMAQVYDFARAVLALAAHPQAEPVAWLAENQDGSFDAYKEVHALIDDCRQGFPVYRATHPAPQAEPTDAMIAAFNAVYNVLDLSDVQTIIRAVLALAAPAVPVTDEAIEDFLATRMTPEGRVPMIKTIREALSHFAAPAVPILADQRCMPNGIRDMLPPLVLTGYQLREALGFLAPDASEDQLESELSIAFREAGTDTDGERYPAGLCCWLTEYPEEGSIALDGKSSMGVETAAQSADAVDASLWRTLINLTGARRRIWNNVFDDEVRGKHNGIEKALAALQSAAHPEAKEGNHG